VRKRASVRTIRGSWTPFGRTRRDDPALYRECEELIENDVGATHGRWSESSRKLLDPLLHVRPIKTTELRVTKERQYVTIECLAVTNPR
jgi:hypothetical protein